MTSLSLVWSSNPGPMLTHVVSLVLKASRFIVAPVLQMHSWLWHVLFGWHCGLHYLPAFLQEQLFFAVHPAPHSQVTWSLCQTKFKSRWQWVARGNMQQSLPSSLAMVEMVQLCTQLFNGLTCTSSLSSLVCFGVLILWSSSSSFPFFCVCLLVWYLITIRKAMKHS